VIAGVHEYGKHVTDAESGLEVFDAPTSQSFSMLHRCRIGGPMSRATRAVDTSAFSHEKGLPSA
jgi:hypothetical protein